MKTMAARYAPAIRLKIILFAYSKGITSSCEIEWRCQTNIIFKALSCDTVPHFTTIASFIRRHTHAVEDLFEQILFTCDEQDLLGHERFAIDGCKMPPNAAKEVSGTFFAVVIQNSHNRNPNTENDLIIKR